MKTLTIDYDPKTNQPTIINKDDGIHESVVNNAVKICGYNLDDGIYVKSVRVDVRNKYMSIKLDIAAGKYLVNDVGCMVFESIDPNMYLEECTLNESINLSRLSDLMQEVSELYSSYDINQIADYLNVKNKGLYDSLANQWYNRTI